MTTLICTTSVSFILPAARCYFGLTPLEEGSLFGAVYVGQLSLKLQTNFMLI